MRLKEGLHNSELIKNEKVEMMMNNFNKGFDGNEIRKELQGKLNRLLKEIELKGVDDNGNSKMSVLLTNDRDSYVSAAVFRKYVYDRLGINIGVSVFLDYAYKRGKSRLYYKKKPQGVYPLEINSDLIAIDAALEAHSGGEIWCLDNHSQNFELVEGLNDKLINPSAYLNTNAGANSNYEKLKYGGSTLMMLLALIDHEPLLKENEKYTKMQQYLLLEPDSTFLSFKYPAYKNIYHSFLQMEKFFDDDVLKNAKNLCSKETKIHDFEKLKVGKDGKLQFDEHNINIYKQHFPMLDFDFLLEPTFDIIISLDHEVGTINGHTKEFYNDEDRVLVNMVATRKTQYNVNTMPTYSFYKRVSDEDYEV